MKPSTALKPEEVEAFYGRQYESGDKIRREHVARHNFRFTARYMAVGKYKLFELLPVRGDELAEFCFLSLSIDKNQGVLIADCFYEHRLKLNAINPPAQKRSVPKSAFQPAPAKKQVEPHADQGKREEPGGALPEKKGKAAAVDRWAI